MTKHIFLFGLIFFPVEVKVNRVRLNTRVVIMMFTLFFVVRRLLSESLMCGSDKPLI